MIFDNFHSCAPTWQHTERATTCLTNTKNSTKVIVLMLASIYQTVRWLFLSLLCVCVCSFLLRATLRQTSRRSLASGRAEKPSTRWFLGAAAWFIVMLRRDAQCWIFPDIQFADICRDRYIYFCLASDLPSKHNRDFYETNYCFI